MRNGHFHAGLALLSAGLISFAPLVCAETLTGRVVSITDGDTLTLQVERQAYRIRLAGIDAPERHQAWSDQSKAHLTRLALNQMASATCPETERWGWKLCKVTVNGVDIGLTQIQAGQAWWYKKYAWEFSAEDRSVYVNAELMAQLRRLGLWGNLNPVPPWEVRREN